MTKKSKKNSPMEGFGDSFHSKFQKKTTYLKRAGTEPYKRAVCSERRQCAQCSMYVSNPPILDVKDLRHRFGLSQRGPNQTPSIVKCLCMSKGLLYAADDQGDVIAFDKDFAISAKKMTYAEVWSMAIDEVGESAFTVRDNDCVVSDLSTVYKRDEYKETLAVKGTLLGRAPVAVSGEFVVIADRSGMDVNVCSAKTNRYEQISSLRGAHDMIVNSVLVSSDGTIFSAGWDCRVIHWKANNGEKINEVKMDSYINVMAWVSTKDKIILIGGKSGFLCKLGF